MTLSKIREALEFYYNCRSSGNTVADACLEHNGWKQKFDNGELAKEALTYLEAYEARERKLLSLIERCEQYIGDKKTYNDNEDEYTLYCEIRQTLNEIKK